jgi:hypothetical protein
LATCIFTQKKKGENTHFSARQVRAPGFLPCKAFFFRLMVAGCMFIQVVP